MAEDTALLREIRDLLRLIAEPALAKRDERFRSLLQEIVGKSRKKAMAVLLMDGSRARPAIRKETAIDEGDLSRLVKALRSAELIGSDDQHLKLVFPVPANLLEIMGKEKE